MIVKEREFPQIIKILEALLRRLPKKHPKRKKIEDDLARRRAGYNGEKANDYFVALLPEDYYIFHDLRLANGKSFFQMDTLLVSANYMVIDEVKSYSGTLFFDRHANQLIKTYNEKQECYQDPITQVENQIRQLKKWLFAHNFPQVPIDYLVSISNPKSLLTTNPGKHHIFERVCHSYRLQNRIENFENMYKEEMLPLKILRKLNRHLLANHTPLVADPFSSYDITKEECLTGVQCPFCLEIPMLKGNNGYWHCSTCGTRSKKAYIQSIEDYFLLISPTINNNQLRQYLHINSRYKAQEILLGMNLAHSGTNKGRTYYRPKKGAQSHKGQAPQETV